MNKNYILRSILFSLCLLSFALVCITNASFVAISEDLVIVGNGTIDRDLSAQSAPDYSGQKLVETIVTVFSPHENTTSFYHSNFELVHSNNSSIYYEAVSELQNSKHFLANNNFELGAYTGFYFVGAQNKSFSFESSPSLSEALLISDAEGRSIVRAHVVNASHHHARTIDTLTWLEGNYSLDWTFLVIGIENPEAGDGDWLSCPHGVVLP